MKAVAISQIEAECRQACAPPAGHVAHAPMQHSPEEGCPMQADHAQADDHAQHHPDHAQHHPDHLRPFPSTAEYVAHLDRADRAEWQKPDAVIAALSLAPDAVVADLGAGSGYFSFRIAASLPAGRVVALDIDPEMVRHITAKATAEKVPNVQALLADPAAPMIPPDTTLALVVDVLHHVPAPAAWLAHVASQLKPGAQLAVIEFRMGDVPVGPPDKHKLSKERLLEMAQAAGLTLAHDHDAVLPYQHLLIFQKP
jgi:SAM-dependent methyltransferase